MEQVNDNNQQYLQAKVLLYQEKYHEALPLFLKVLEQSPKHPDARKYLSICYLQIDRHELAMQSILLYLDASSADYRFLNYAATVFAYNKKLHEAKDLFIKALQLTPAKEAAMLYDDIATWLFYDSHPQIAVRYLEKANELSPKPSQKIMDKLDFLYKNRIEKSSPHSYPENMLHNINIHLTVVFSNDKERYYLLQHNNKLYADFAFDKGPVTHSVFTKLSNDCFNEFQRGNVEVFDDISKEVQYAAHQQAMNSAGYNLHALNKSAKNAIEAFNQTFDNCRFPIANAKNKTWLINNTIYFFATEQWRNFELDVNTLMAIFLDLRTDDPCLILIGNTTHKVPLNAQCLKAMIYQLAGILDISLQRVMNILQNEGDGVFCAWRKTGNQTYQLQSHKPIDYDLGFEVLSPTPVFINWDIPMHDIVHSYGHLLKTSENHASVLHFKYPVRVGNIVLNQLIFHKTKRNKLPSQSFYAKCYHHSATDKSYYELKEKLRHDFPNDEHHFNYERSNRMSYSFKGAGIYFNLKYSYFCDWEYEHCFTFFTIENKRDYSHLLQCNEYEKKLEVSALHHFTENLRLNADFRESNHVFLRPKSLQNQGDLIIWIDLKNDIIGFADKQYCLLFTASHIEYFALMNIRPAKGGGGSYLDIKLISEKSSFEVLSGKCYALDEPSAQIQRITAKKVKQLPEATDC